MTELAKLTNWLKTFPLWNDETMYIDYTAAAPNNAGLFPAGMEEVSRTEDVLGNVTVKNIWRFALYRITQGQQDNTANALWLMQLQSWLQSQSARGLAPTFGDDPKGERIYGEKGRLKETTQTGTAKYLVTLVVEFTKIYHK